MTNIFLDKSIQLLKNFVNINGSGLHALWFRSEEHFIRNFEIINIIKLFEPLQSCLWHISSGDASSQKINDYKRSFGSWDRLSKNIISCKDIEMFGKKYYSDICNFTENNNIESFFRRSLFGCDSTIMFLEQIDISNINNCNIRNLENVWLTRQSESKIYPSKEKHKIIELYVLASCGIGGIPGIILSDTETTKIFVFIGHTDIISKIFLQSKNNFNHIDSREANNWLLRGLHLDLLA